MTSLQHGEGPRFESEPQSLRRRGFEPHPRHIVCKASLAQSVDNLVVVGSSPTGAGRVAQSVERRSDKAKVLGSSPSMTRPQLFILPLLCIIWQMHFTGIPDCIPLADWILKTKVLVFLWIHSSHCWGGLSPPPYTGPYTGFWECSLVCGCENAGSTAGGVVQMVERALSMREEANALSIRLQGLREYAAAVRRRAGRRDMPWGAGKVRRTCRDLRGSSGTLARDTQLVPCEMARLWGGTVAWIAVAWGVGAQPAYCLDLYQMHRGPRSVSGPLGSWVWKEIWKMIPPPLRHPLCLSTSRTCSPPVPLLGNVPCIACLGVSQPLQKAVARGTSPPLPSPRPLFRVEPGWCGTTRLRVRAWYTDHLKLNYPPPSPAQPSPGQARPGDVRPGQTLHTH
eukprot:gene22284-biopygen1160